MILSHKLNNLPSTITTGVEFGLIMFHFNSSDITGDNIKPSILYYGHRDIESDLTVFCLNSSGFTGYMIRPQLNNPSSVMTTGMKFGLIKFYFNSSDINEDNMKPQTE